MSQRVCAELVGRTEGWLSQIERGIRPLDRLSVLVELARVLRVDPGELTGAAIRQLAPNGHDHPALLLAAWGSEHRGRDEDGR